MVVATPVIEPPVDLKSPFTPEIDRAWANPKKKIPPLETSDGTGDPYDHIHAYDLLMRYYEHFDAAKYQIFVTTLKKGVCLWMASLPPNSIRSWQELCDKFHDHFGSNNRRGKLTASLNKATTRRKFGTLR